MRWTLPVTVLAAAGCSSSGDPVRPILVPAPASPVRVGAGPGQPALVDVDHDGHVDLVARHLLGRNVMVLRGDGRGAFAVSDRSRIALEYQPGAMALGDLDGDRRTDLVLAYRDGGRECVEVLRGTGDGTFVRAPGSPVTVEASIETYKPSVVLADVDEDRRPDVLVSNGRRHTVVILLGDGAGRLRRGDSVDLGAWEGVSSFALGDVDPDGHLDLVAATGDGVSVRRGDGRGGFGAPRSTTVGTRPRLECVADVDGDRLPDLVLTHPESPRLSVLLNRGDGAFVPAPGSPFELALPATAAAVADMDRDGRADLVVATVAPEAPFDSWVEVRTGPTFVAAPGSPFPSGRGAYHMTVGDADGDGRPDVAAANFEGDSVVLLLGRE